MAGLMGGSHVASLRKLNCCLKWGLLNACEALPYQPILFFNF